LVLRPNESPPPRRAPRAGLRRVSPQLQPHAVKNVATSVPNPINAPDTTSSAILGPVGGGRGTEPAHTLCTVSAPCSGHRLHQQPRAWLRLGAVAMRHLRLRTSPSKRRRTFQTAWPQKRHASVLLTAPDSGPAVGAFKRHKYVSMSQPQQESQDCGRDPVKCDHKLLSCQSPFLVGNAAACLLR
jgi:hypothetical protein